MANWRQLAMSALLADGSIDEREVEILRKEFFADRRIDRAEMEFLLEARKRAVLREAPLRGAALGRPRGRRHHAREDRLDPRVRLRRQQDRRGREALAE